MANKNKAKGTAAETKIVKFLNEYNIDAQRKVLTGSEDHGDIDIHLPNGKHFMIEVKAGKQTNNPSRAQLTEWIRQTIIEERNCNKNQWTTGWLIVARYGRAVKDYDVWWWITTSQVEQRGHMYLDDFRQYVFNHCI